MEELALHQEINALPCFNQSVVISKVTAGESNESFVVQDNEQRFFVKHFSCPEQGKVETHFAVMFHQENISPKVVYADKYWLVTRYIEQANYPVYPQHLNHIIVALSHVHALPVSATPFDLKAMLYDLAKSCFISSSYQMLVSQVIDSLPDIVSSQPLVYCHGDLNLTNCLLSKNKVWLVDFECTVVSHIEYDLAMFIAINLLKEKEINAVICQYEQVMLNRKIDKALLETYLKYAFLINAIWYRAKAKDLNNNFFTQKYLQQLDRFSLLAPQEKAILAKMR